MSEYEQPIRGAEERALEGPRSERHAEARSDRGAARRFLGFTALGTLVPGAGLIAAGRRRVGTLVLLLFVLGLAAVIVFVLAKGRRGLLDLAVDRSFMTVLCIALVALAVAWVLIALVSHRLLEPRRASTTYRVLGALTVVVLGSAVAGPLLVGARDAYVSRQLIALFPTDGNKGVSLTAPTAAQPKADPFANQPRLNVLLLGSDAGADRTGTRPDTTILASIDTRTGRSVLFSLPRNLQRVPFPDLPGVAGELHRLYPRGFTYPAPAGDTGEALLNAIYTNAPAAHPEIFAGVSDPGAEATKLAVMGALGVSVDYYVMVNLQGFSDIVDALGGVRINVPYDVPVNSVHSTSNPSRCTRPTSIIKQGADTTLNGEQALWYARARCGSAQVSDDYQRMRRQRCLVGAIAQQTDPGTVLLKFQQLASAAKGLIETDLPATLLPALVDLAPKITKSGLSSVAFTDQVINTANPDYDLMHSLVQQALVPPAQVTPVPAATAPSPTHPAVPPTPSASPTPNQGFGTPSPSPTGAADTGQAQALTAVC